MRDFAPEHGQAWVKNLVQRVLVPTRALVTDAHSIGMHGLVVEFAGAARDRGSRAIARPGPVPSAKQPEGSMPAGVQPSARESRLTIPRTARCPRSPYTGHSLISRP